MHINLNVFEIAEFETAFTRWVAATNPHDIAKAAIRRMLNNEPVNVYEAQEIWIFITDVKICDLWHDDMYSTIDAVFAAYKLV